MRQDRCFAAWCGNHGANSEDNHVAFQQIDIARDRGRRRPWPTSFKEQVVLETLVPGASVSAIARQHDIDTSLIYRWRRQCRVEKVDDVGGGRFLPVAISDQVPGTRGKTEVATRTAGRSKPRRAASRIEIELAGGRTIRVDAGIDAEALARILDVVDRRG
ncbi:MAG TPA: hypothetical protein ENH55_19765 [Aurantimonas coralicida]|uniref:Transposase n=1 Tax=Aurantimonas coralicida TaxID=182270 RepID=A0A9C9NCI7_9HYPH|nr:hypothetical protein [Aurantimonas coralicida]HET99509.1 hypothetical protein [Aurantimonas coralicida]